MVKKKTKQRAAKPTKKQSTKLPAPLLEPVMKELELAYSRINGNSIRRLCWLLDFAESDFDKLSEGKLVDVGWETAAFALPDNPRRLSYEALSEVSSILEPWGEEIGEVKAPSSSFGVSEIQATKPSLELVRWFHEHIKRAFEALYSGERLAFKYPGTTKWIALQQIGGKPDSWEELPPHELLMLRAFELLEAEKDRLRICESPNCKKRFVATKRGLSRFHSPTCSAYVRIARSRGKKI